MSPSINGCSSTSGNLVSCSLLTFCFFFPHLFLLWRWHLWYLSILFTYMYQCSCYRWCHSPFHHFLNPCIYVLLFFFILWSWGYTFLKSILPLENTPWRLCYNFSFVFQCCLNILSSSFDLGLWFLWIFLLVDKQIFKNLCQDEGWLTHVLIVSFNLLDIFVPSIQLITQTIVHNLHPQPYRACNVIILLTCPFGSSTYLSTQNLKTFIINYLHITYTLS